MGNINIQQEQTTLLIRYNPNIDTINRLVFKTTKDSLEFFPDSNGEFRVELLHVLNYFSYDSKAKIHTIMEQNISSSTIERPIIIHDVEVKVVQLSVVNTEHLYLQPFVTKSGILQYKITSKPSFRFFFSRTHINNLKINNHKALIDGQFSIINATFEYATIVLKTRKDNYSLDCPVECQQCEPSESSHYYRFHYRKDLYNELTQFLKHCFKQEDVIDVFLNIYVKELVEPLHVKIGKPRIMAEIFLKGELITRYRDCIQSISPYFTMKGRNLSFKINQYTVENYLTYLESLKSPYKHCSKDKIWVIGEKRYKAQDNGYHFFKYMRTTYPELPVYYVIDQTSPERFNVEPYGNVIYFGTKTHFKLMLDADYICATHYPSYLYPSNSKIYTRRIKATKVFLQHGILGTKNLVEINGRQVHDFDIDLFITSSEREKDIVVRDLKFSPNTVKVTGLPRFDELFNDNTPTKNQILIIPTWRDWLTSRNQLSQSNYLIRINTLLQSQILKTLSNQGMDVVFCLHPNMQPFIDMFNTPKYIKKINQGEVEVQQLIKESRLMITDYSSVAFDFSFLNKPIIYYQFDKKQFIGRLPSHINIEEELPGIIVNTEEDLEHVLSDIVSRNFTISDKILQRAHTFYPFRDTHNCERIYNEIIHFNKRNSLPDKLKYHTLTQHIFKRFRKHSKYYVIMRCVNHFITTLIPIKKDLIVFESNIGKSVSDSPKAIYDVLKQHPHSFNIVWINNSIYPFNDSKVISVKRLSPMYFYYLSRAKYWVNNQNFPYYIKKHRHTTYIQTWHGTPLKKMLNDVKEFKGKDKEYKKRVNIATQRWDYLISPSPYASKCFKSAFNFKKEILELGYPRNDILYLPEDKKQDKIASIKQSLGIPIDKKVLLYAPTFRDDEVNKKQKHIIDLKLDLFKMKEDLGNNFILLLRPHIIISNSLKIDQTLSDFIINVANYNDINALYLITDICITDYSSVMFDFANTKKPLLFYAYDLSHYRDTLRGFYLNFEDEVPGPISESQSQLIHHIKNIETIQKTYELKYNAFYNKYCTYETGHASKSIVNRFFS